MARQFFSGIRSAQFVSLALACSPLACNTTGFQGDSNKTSKQPAPAVATPAIPTPGTRQVTDEFAMSSSQGMLDIVWVIDNSGSMKEEAAQVQRNFAAFVSSLAGRTDAKIGLLSSTGSSTSVNLPIGTANSQQFPINVGSTNALSILAAAICPTATTTMTIADLFSSGTGSNNATICGQQAVATDVDFPYIEGKTAITGAAGQLNQFFRPGAKPVFVIVTDDNADAVNQTNFVNMVKQHLNNETPTVFAFRGTATGGSINCEVANPGVAYDALAQQTGGAAFDICTPDWSPNFNQLSKQVIQLSTTHFSLKTANAVRVLSVTVDGRVLPADSYEFNTGALVLKPSAAVSPDAKTLVVQYEVNG